jgi:hypothetical protein
MARHQDLIILATLPSARSLRRTDCPRHKRDREIASVRAFGAAEERGVCLGLPDDLRVGMGLGWVRRGLVRCPAVDGDDTDQKERRDEYRHRV